MNFKITIKLIVFLNNKIKIKIIMKMKRKIKKLKIVCNLKILKN